MVIRARRRLARRLALDDRNSTNAPGIFQGRNACSYPLHLIALKKIAPLCRKKFILPVTHTLRRHVEMHPASLSTFPSWETIWNPAESELLSDQLVQQMAASRKMIEHSRSLRSPVSHMTLSSVWQIVCSGVPASYMLPASLNSVQATVWDMLRRKLEGCPCILQATHVATPCRQRESDIHQMHILLSVDDLEISAQAEADIAACIACTIFPPD